MVGPGIPEEERLAANRRLKAGFVGLVAASAGLMALRIDPTVGQLAGAVAAGGVVGVVLLWFVLRTLEEFRRSA